MNKWRLLNFRVYDGGTNMAIDEAILIAYGSTESNLPTLRLYGWQPPAVSLGCSQKFEKSVNLSCCQKFNIDIVRRPTGGRAVLHYKEVTYSVVAGWQDIMERPSVIECYRKIASAIIAGLRLLGINAQFSTLNKEYKPTEDDNFCFAFASRSDILATNNKKLVGSAQLHKNNKILQHGSIIIEAHTELLQQLFANREHKFNANITSISELLQKQLSIEEVCNAVIQGFREILNIEFVEGDLTELEKKYRNNLLKEKYQNLGWLHRV